HGLSGLLVAGGMAGLLLIAMGLFRLGKLIQFIPHPVTTGFTAGIGTVIAVLQLKDLLGFKMDHNPEQFVDRVMVMIQAGRTVNLSESAVGCATLLLLIILPKIIKRVPAPLIALTAMSII